MKQRILHFIITLMTLAILCISINACAAYVNKPPAISGITATHLLVYPKGTVELECIASDNEGDNMSFTWSSTDGEITGNGPKVTWTAPNEYGEFHIMVLVEDEDGGSSKDSITIGVVVNKNTKTTCCN
jgi:hypothetical protein